MRGKHHAMKAYGELRYNSKHSYPWHWMEVSGKLHARSRSSIKRCPSDWIANVANLEDKDLDIFEIKSSCSQSCYN
jgi:hypothetical protein